MAGGSQETVDGTPVGLAELLESFRFFGGLDETPLGRGKGVLGSLVRRWHAAYYLPETASREMLIIPKVEVFFTRVLRSE